MYEMMVHCTVYTAHTSVHCTDLFQKQIVQGVAIGTTKAMSGKLTAPFVSKVKPKTRPSVVICALRHLPENTSII